MESLDLRATCDVPFFFGFIKITEDQKILNIKKTEIKIKRAILSEFISFFELINIFNNIPYVFSAALPVMNLELILNILINKFR